MTDQRQPTETEEPDFGVDLGEIGPNSSVNSRELLGRTELAAMAGRGDVNLADDDAVEKLVDLVLKKASAKTDQRFSGMQGLVDRKFSQISERLEAIARGEVEGTTDQQENEAERLLASYGDGPDSDEEDVEPEFPDDAQPASDRDEELEQLRAELELSRRKDSHPIGARLLEAAMRAESLDDQVELLEGAFLAALEDALAARGFGQDGAATEPDPVPEVDRNNPPRAPRHGLATALAGAMDEDAADAILGTFGDQKGAFGGRR